MKTRLFFLLTIIYGIVSLSSFAQDPHAFDCEVCKGQSLTRNNFAQDSPHEIRIIYFLPRNRQPHPNIDTKIDMLIKEAQQFYADRMNANGFGRKTFKLETDDSGSTQVHHVDGQFTAEYYNSEPGVFDRILSEINEQFDTSQNIYFIVADVTYPGSHWRGGGQAFLGGPSIVYIPFDSPFVSRYFAAHEIGHSFGLQHDFRYASGHSTDIMSYVGGIDFEDRTLSKCAAEWLDVSAYFNPDQTSNNEPATIQMLTPFAYAPNAISLRFEVTDPNGIHQAQLIIPRESGFSLHGFKSLNGARNSTIEFITTELTTSRNEVELGIIDVHGNFRWEPYSIAVDDIQPADVINVNNPAPEWLQKVSGDNQTGYLNNRLIDPFVVIVRDIDDEPVAGVQVMFQVIAGEGELSVTNPWTDSDGLVQTYLTLGSLQTDPLVSVRVSGISEPITFTATVTQPPAEIINSLAKLTGHTGEVTDVAYSFDGSTLASLDDDRIIRLWDATTGKHKEILRGFFYALAFSPDELTLASTAFDFDRRNGIIHLWDIVTGRSKLTFDVPTDGIIGAVAYSPDGSTLASGSGVGDVHLLDASTGQRKVPLAPGHTNWVSDLTFSPDGSTLASVSADNTIRLWDTVTGAQLESLEANYLGGDIEFRDDGRTLAILDENSLKLWDSVTGQLSTFIQSQLPLSSGLTAFAFSPDGRTLATGSYSGEMRLWDPVTGALQKILIGHESIITSIMFSPDSNRLASGSTDKTVRLWELTPMTGALTFNPSTVADQTFTVGEAVNLTLPVAIGGTPPYTYTLAPLPEGLSFEATERVLSGTLTTAGTTTATYTATDAANVSASLAFTIEVTAGVILDVNGDGQVTVIDLAVVALFYGTQVPADTRLPADVNADGVVDILDLTAVAQGIDAAGGGVSVFSLKDVEDALLAAVKQAEEFEVVAEAPMGFSTHVPSTGIASNNVSAALADVRHLAGSDVRLVEKLTVLSELLQLLAEMRAIPETTMLLPNYPNPFNPETWIPYQLAKPADVTLTIYAVNGQVARRFALGHQLAGVYQSKSRAVYWNGRNDVGEPVASGIYFYTFTAGDFSATRKMLIRK